MDKTFTNIKTDGYDLYMDSSSETFIKYHNNIATAWILRSTDRTNNEDSDKLWNINTNGIMRSTMAASISYGIVPALCLG